uniref:Uncharacterized protein n=1 Tax=Fundulus heteroclitus TaxID=8078 RepID=A0A3Q2UMC6_FUNHE
MGGPGAESDPLRQFIQPSRAKKGILCHKLEAYILLKCIKWLKLVTLPNINLFLHINCINWA